MALLDRVRERTGSDLSDAELTAMIAGITAELDARFGPAGAAVQTFGDLENPESGTDHAAAYPAARRGPGGDHPRGTARQRRYRCACDHAASR
jgi:hypothetical protein